MAVVTREAPEAPVQDQEQRPARIRPQRKWRQPRLPTMAHYLAFFVSGWVVVTVLTVLGAIGGAAYATTVPREWEASASIELPDLPVYVDLTSKGPPAKRATIDTTGQLAFSKPVLRAIGKVLKVDDDAAAQALTVSAYPLSRVIILTVNAPTDYQAINAANAAADSLADNRKKLLAGSVDRQNARDLRDELRDDLQDAIEEYGYSSVTVRIQQQINEINENLAQYDNGGHARVVNRAKPAKVVPPHPETYVTTGAVAGFMIGIVWIWWRPRKAGSVAQLSAWQPFSRGA